MMWGPKNVLTDGTVCIRIVWFAPLFGRVCCAACADGPTCSKRYWPFSVFSSNAEPDCPGIPLSVIYHIEWKKRILF